MQSHLFVKSKSKVHFTARRKTMLENWNRSIENDKINIYVKLQSYLKTLKIYTRLKSDRKKEEDFCPCHKFYCSHRKSHWVSFLIVFIWPFSFCWIFLCSFSACDTSQHDRILALSIFIIFSYCFDISLFCYAPAAIVELAVKIGLGFLSQYFNSIPSWSFLFARKIKVLLNILLAINFFFHWRKNLPVKIFWTERFHTKRTF